MLEDDDPRGWHLQSCCSRGNFPGQNSGKLVSWKNRCELHGRGSLAPMRTWKNPTFATWVLPFCIRIKMFFFQILVFIRILICGLRPKKTNQIWKEWNLKWNLLNLINWNTFIHLCITYKSLQTWLLSFRNYIFQNVWRFWENLLFFTKFLSLVWTMDVNWRFTRILGVFQNFWTLFDVYQAIFSSSLVLKVKSGLPTSRDTVVNWKRF